TEPSPVAVLPDARLALLALVGLRPEPLREGLGVEENLHPFIPRPLFVLAAEPAAQDESGAVSLRHHATRLDELAERVVLFAVALRGPLHARGLEEPPLTVQRDRSLDGPAQHGGPSPGWIGEHRLDRRVLLGLGDLVVEGK